MDRPVSGADASRSFSRSLREVRDGASYVVTAHGRPAARIVPFKKGHGARLAARGALFERVDAQPTMNTGPWTRDELHERQGCITHLTPTPRHTPKA